MIEKLSYKLVNYVVIFCCCTKNSDT